MKGARVAKAPPAGFHGRKKRKYTRRKAAKGPGGRPPAPERTRALVYDHLIRAKAELESAWTVIVQRRESLPASLKDGTAVDVAALVSQVARVALKVGGV